MAGAAFNQEAFDRICERIEAGESLISICADRDMPGKSLVLKWLRNDTDGALRNQYARAREGQADHFAEQVVDIADECGDPAATRNRIDARKWAAGKLAPKKYGDKLAIGGDETGVPIRQEITWLPSSE